MKVIDTYNAMVGAAVASFLMFWDLTGSCLHCSWDSILSTG